MSEIIKNAIVTEFGKRSVQQAISVERVALMRDMLATATSTAEGSAPISEQAPRTAVSTSSGTCRALSLPKRDWE